MKRILVLCYLHVTFLLKVRTHLHQPEFLHVTKIKVNNVHSVFLNQSAYKFILKSPSQTEFNLNVILYYYP